MSKLEELIKEFCPNGVEYRSLLELVDIHKGIQFNKKDMAKEGSYPVINGGIAPSGYVENYNEQENTITISQGGASAGYVNWLLTKFWAGAHCYVVKPLNNEILDNRYLFHFTKNNESILKQCQYGAGIPALAKSTIQELQIPLPALPVQREIVRILDSFTLYSAELTAELTARRKQYEFYRDKLLTFDDLSSKVETFTIEDICKTITDFTAAGSFADIAKNVVYKSTPDFARLVRTMDIKSNFTKGEPVYVDENAFKYLWRVNFDQDCIILPNIGANCGEVYYMGKGTLPYQNNVLGPNAIMLKNISCNVRYLYHLLLLSDFQNDLRRIISPGGQTKFNKTELKKIKIKIPPIEVQERIVKVLDNFDAICSDLGIGLPAEIEKRQKQYEYYRDKLLSFDINVDKVINTTGGATAN